MQPDLFSLPFVSDVEGCSRQGAIAGAEKVARQCLVLLSAYRTHGPLNDREAEEVTGIKDTTICARRRELFGRGLIQRHGKAKAASGVMNTKYGLAIGDQTA